MCDDIRTNDEHEALRRSGWCLVRLNVSEDEQHKRLSKCYPDTLSVHLAGRNAITETALDEETDWDLFFNADVSEQICWDAVSTILNA